MQASIASAIAAAARSGYVAANFSGGSSQWGLAAAGALARAPYDTVLTKMHLRGAAAVKAKLVLTSESQRPIGGALARTLAGTPDMEADFPIKKPIKAQETIAAYIDNGNNSETDALVAIFCDGKGKKPGSYIETFPIRAYSATTLTQYAWTPGNFTIDGGLLPNRIYHLLGASAWSAGLAAMRFVAQSGDESRPTVIGAPTAITARMQMFPEVLEFAGNLPPTFEAVSFSADTAEEAVLYLGDTGRDIGPGIQQGRQQQ